ncbi:DUF3293 domain-containing protein [Reinekea forsetii]|uniref:DUF3293 domain-containing protein n=1 Tax=Reinekea forsetii TaxID=1336806 RepID=A0A2K8KR53_9GAMM|nr:DUF3293 domain-containing protein [Reinekea forsetii]ATX77092.1 hypothetical protein REIFOR_01955 [Reinekea forsetii]
MTGTVTDAQMIQAYEETEYRVLGESPFVLKIGQANSDLLRLYRQQSVSTSVFITAWNPFSHAYDDTHNNKFNLDLAHDLVALELNFIDGIGQHPSGDWPGEDSFLVFGTTIDSAKLLGVTYRQNAIIWSDSDGVPQLVLLQSNPSVAARTVFLLYFYFIGIS